MKGAGRCAMLEKKPQWVLQWVWDEHRDLCGRAESIGDNPALAEKFIVARDCDVVWNAIDKRRAQYQRIWIDPTREIPLSALYDLVAVVEFASRGLKHEEKLTASQRKKMAESVTDATEALRSALQALRSDDGEWFWGLQRTLLADKGSGIGSNPAEDLDMIVDSLDSLTSAKSRVTCARCTALLYVTPRRR
jgi:hypothetical protein